MLIPRFTIRWLLGLTTFSAGVSLILSFAVRGKPWAIGAAAGMMTLVVAALLYMSAFFAVWLMSQFFNRLHRGSAAAGSPFAKDAQLVSRPNETDLPPAMTG